MCLIQQLGSGGSGKVYLAELLKCTDSEGGRKLVAVKVMDKDDIQGSDIEARAQKELEILKKLNHPFLPKLYGMAEDDRFICLLMELCTGGNLYTLQQRQSDQRFDESAVRFYAAEVVAAIEYMHLNGVVYRDLKPDNILIQSDGHLMLTDFDLSLKSENESCVSVQIIPDTQKSILSCFRARREGELLYAQPNARSCSFVGTREYLAPEIISGRGHGSAVDWWSLGVVVYELLYGVTPFLGSTREETLSNVLYDPLEFPKHPRVSTVTKRFIVELLTKDPRKCLGCTTGATAIKMHPFFSGVNWALLKSADPPHIPPPFTKPTFRDTDNR